MEYVNMYPKENSSIIIIKKIINIDWTNRECGNKWNSKWNKGN